METQNDLENNKVNQDKKQYESIHLKYANFQKEQRSRKLRFKRINKNNERI